MPVMVGECLRTTVTRSLDGQIFKGVWWHVGIRRYYQTRRELIAFPPSGSLRRHCSELLAPGLPSAFPKMMGLGMASQTSLASSNQGMALV